MPLAASARAFVVPGETLISVRGGAHVSGFSSGLTELGLAADDVRITPYYEQLDLIPTGHGGVAHDVIWRLGYADVSCDLIHHDPAVLDVLLSESAGGGVAGGPLSPTGRMLGGRRAMYESGNHYFSIHLLPAQLGVLPYRFRRCHLAAKPVVLPLGTDVQRVQVSFRCLPDTRPYRLGTFSGMNAQPAQGGQVNSLRREVLGSGAVVWDRVIDD